MTCDLWRVTCVHLFLLLFARNVLGDAPNAAVSFAFVENFSIVFAGNSGEVLPLFVPTMIEASGDVLSQCGVWRVTCDV